MPINLLVAGATVPASTVRVRVGDILRPVKQVRVQTATGLRVAFSSIGGLSALANPPNVSGNALSGHRTTVYSSQTAISVSGGQAGYSYTWSIDNGRITIASQSMATTAFQANLLNEAIEGTATCTVTDAGGQSTQVTVDVQLSHDSFQ